MYARRVIIQKSVFLLLFFSKPKIFELFLLLLEITIPVCRTQANRKYFCYSNFPKCISIENLRYNNAAEEYLLEFFSVFFFLLQQYVCHFLFLIFYIRFYEKKEFVLFHLNHVFNREPFVFKFAIVDLFQRNRTGETFICLFCLFSTVFFLFIKFSQTSLKRLFYSVILFV